MAAGYFLFRQFVIAQDRCAMKVTSDAIRFGALVTVPEKASRVLDIGCGTGLLSLMLAQRYPSILIEGIELDENAAVQAAKNISKSRFSKRITVQQADARTWNPSRKYDFIISNPPFYTNSIRSKDLAKSMAWHDDTLSADELAITCKQVLSKGGKISILLPESELQEFEKSMASAGFCLIQLQYLEMKNTKNRCRIIATWQETTAIVNVSTDLNKVAFMLKVEQANIINLESFLLFN